MLKRLFSIYTRFLRIGAFTIGGGIVMLGVIESEVRATGEFSDDEITDMIVLATAVPGPIATNLSFIAGKAMAGWSGAFAAVLGTATAPFLVILILSSLIINHLKNPWLVSFFLGASAGVVVVVWNSLWKMIKNAVLITDENPAMNIKTAMLINFSKEDGSKGFRKYCRTNVAFMPLIAFITTAWAIMSWEAHPFAALTAGALISYIGIYLSRRGLKLNAINNNINNNSESLEAKV